MFTYEGMLLVWLIIIVAAFVIEIFTQDLVTIWFSLGAVVAFIAGILGIPDWAQIIVFIASSIVLLLLTRPVAMKYMVKNTVKTNADRVIGKIARVTKMIPVGDRGEVKIDGKYWLAFTQEDEAFEVDEQCRVIAIEGVKLLVGKVK
jgi:membrane protein implicated in regulation of membrane protease activity